MSKGDQSSSQMDTIKLVIAVVLLVAAIAGFYYFATWQGQPVSVLYRVLGLLAVMGGASYIAFTTVQGARLLSFLKDSRTEVRKMVWPTRVETMQTTLMVVVIVIILAIFLWLVDMMLGWAIKSLLGAG